MFPADQHHMTALVAGLPKTRGRMVSKTNASLDQGGRSEDTNVKADAPFPSCPHAGTDAKGQLAARVDAWPAPMVSARSDARRLQRNRATHLVPINPQLRAQDLQQRKHRPVAGHHTAAQVREAARTGVDRQAGE